LTLEGQESSCYPLADVDMPNDAMRLLAIRGLIERGHLAQIPVSHDICYRSRLVRWGGHGYGHIFTNVIPLMRRRGLSERRCRPSSSTTRGACSRATPAPRR
jgi:phosphotriesterase-related protein